jgi:hypothetical protein
MSKLEAIVLLRAAIAQYPNDRDLRWSAVRSLGEKFAKHFTFNEMQAIANAATDSDTINVVDKAWDGIKAKDGAKWWS